MSITQDHLKCINRLLFIFKLISFICILLGGVGLSLSQPHVILGFSLLGLGTGLFWLGADLAEIVAEWWYKMDGITS